MRLSAPVAQKHPGKCEKAVRNSLSENGVSDEAAPGFSPPRL
jgi:hypothetical protein